MKTLLAVALATVLFLTHGAAWAQNGNMMNGGVWSAGWMGGVGGIWMPILLVIVVVGVVTWIVAQKDK